MLRYMFFGPKSYRYGWEMKVSLFNFFYFYLRILCQLLLEIRHWYPISWELVALPCFGYLANLNFIKMFMVRLQDHD